MGGWLLTGWISRRTEGDRASTMIAAVPAWLLALPLTVGALPVDRQVGRPWDEGFFVGLHATLVPWPDLGFDTINPVLGMALCALAPAVLTAATARRPRAMPATTRRPRAMPADGSGRAVGAYRRTNPDTGR